MQNKSAVIIKIRVPNCIKMQPKTTLEYLQLHFKCKVCTQLDVLSYDAMAVCIYFWLHTHSGVCAKTAKIGERYSSILISFDFLNI